MANVTGKINRIAIHGTVANKKVSGSVSRNRLSCAVTSNLIQGVSGYSKLVATLERKVLNARLTELMLIDHQIISGEEMALAKRVDVVTDDLIYVGEAPAGTLDNEPRWRIKRTLVNGEDVAIEYAEGTDKFDKVWTDHTNYNYR